jgi:hypothetical protein
VGLVNRGQVGVVKKRGKTAGKAVKTAGKVVEKAVKTVGKRGTVGQ